jgi:hypothetical protein
MSIVIVVMSPLYPEKLEIKEHINVSPSGFGLDSCVRRNDGNCSVIFGHDPEIQQGQFP